MSKYGEMWAGYVNTNTSWTAHEKACAEIRARWTWAIMQLNVARRRYTLDTAIRQVEQARRSAGDELVVMPNWAIC